MEFSKTANFAWQFNLDTINQYAYWDNFLSKEECEKIITIGISKNLEIANTKNNNIKFKLSGNILNSKIRLIPVTRIPLIKSL